MLECLKNLTLEIKKDFCTFPHFILDLSFILLMFYTFTHFEKGDQGIAPT